MLASDFFKYGMMVQGQHISFQVSSRKDQSRVLLLWCSAQNVLYLIFSKNIWDLVALLLERCMLAALPSHVMMRMLAALRAHIMTYEYDDDLGASPSIFIGMS